MPGVRSCSVYALLVLASAVYTKPALAQFQTNPRSIIVVVPMTGSGSYDDPRRPMFTLAKDRDLKGTDGSDVVLDYRYVTSDDGMRAIVEFSMANLSKATLSSMKDLATSKLAGFSVFERGKNSRSEVETELRKYKKDFDFDDFAGLKQNGGSR